MANQSKDVKKFLIKWFEEKLQKNPSEYENFTEINYFDESWMDSYQFIALIGDIEEELGVSFSQEDLESEKFATIQGINELIVEKQ